MKNDKIKEFEFIRSREIWKEGEYPFEDEKEKNTTSVDSEEHK